MEAKRGMIVRSAAGRDKGRTMVILSTDGDFAMIADGKLRKLASPKKKRLKHLRFMNTTVDMQDLTDRKLRKLLREDRTPEPDKQNNPNP